MPRYFFDFRDEDGDHPDDVGLDFANLAAARAEALKALGEMVLEASADDRPELFLAIDIRDGVGGRLLASVAVSGTQITVQEDWPPGTRATH